METPDNLRYSTEHEWVRLEGDNVSEMGVFGAVEAVKTVSDLYSPLGGEVIEVNYELEDNPEMVNQEPYGNGWMIKIRVENMGAFTSLMQANDYRSFIGV